MNLQKAKKATPIIIIGIIIIVVFLTYVIVSLFKSPKKEEQQVTQTQNSQEIVQIRNKLLSKLPVATKTYTIEYLKTSDKIIVSIISPPLEENKKAVEKWLSEQGVKDPTAFGVIFNLPKGK